MASRNTIGIIAGAGPEAGIDLWQRILKANREIMGQSFSGDLDAPKVIIHSIPELGHVIDIENHEEDVWKTLRKTIVELDKSVDYFAIACNILHHYADRIKKLQLSSEFVSIVEVASEYIKENNVEDIALLSIKSVAELGFWSPYKQLTQYANVEKPKKPDEINLLVKDIKRLGPTDNSLVARYDDILENLSSSSVLLACTELPLITPKTSNKELVNVSDLLAKELTRRSFKEPLATFH